MSVRPTGSCTPGLTAISLFCGAGIGDLGLKAAGFQFLAMCEREADRAALSSLNFPAAEHIVGDISAAPEALADRLGQLVADSGEELFLMTVTAPCQGMSKSGMGTLLNNIRKGNRPKLDPRNRLILPALQIVASLRPRWVIFENVIEMRSTVIEDENGEMRPILEIVNDALAPEYVGEAYDVEFADYGIAQRRQRLITAYTRDEVARRRFSAGARLIPEPTHAKESGKGKRRWVSVLEALSDFPPLDAGHAEAAVDDSVPFHRVPVLDEKKYEWVRHTPPGKSAFDNQCVNPACGFAQNETHGARKVSGINRAKRDTPLYCEGCGSLLPRPFTEIGDGEIRLMRGYTSAYKRMGGELPAPALTRNLSYPCSDNKIHPTQNRVLSLAEAMVLQTISDFDYAWGPVPGVGRRRRTAMAPDSLIRLVIGESVPPRFLRMLGEHVLALSDAERAWSGKSDSERAQLSLLAS